MKILIISTPTPYINMLQRSAMLSDVEVVGTVGSLNEALNLIDEPGLDCILASDRLYTGTVPELVQTLEQRRRGGLLYFILEEGSQDQMRYLDSCSIPYTLQKDMPPIDFLDKLSSGEIRPGKIGREEKIQKDQKKLDQLKTDPSAAFQTDGVQEPADPLSALAAGILPDKEDDLSNGPRWRAEASLEAAGRQEMTSSIDYTRQRNRQFDQPDLDTRPGYGSEYRNPNDQANAIQFKPIAVCINSPKGGVGKTTLAVELASLIALRAGELDLNEIGHLSYNKKIRVCLVDMNPSFDTMASTFASVYNVDNHSTVSSWFQMIDQKIIETLDAKTRQELIRSGYRGIEKYFDPSRIRFTQDEIQSMTVSDPETGLTILPSIKLPLDASFARPEYLDLILRTLKDFFDVVIIDTGNNIGAFTIAAMRASDEVLLVCTKSKGAAATIMKLTQSLNDMRNPVDMKKFNLVINSPNGAGSFYDTKAFGEILGMPVVAEIPYDEKMRAVHEEGEFYSVNNKKTDFSKACIKLAQQICPLWIVVPNRADAPRRKKRKGLFGFGK